MCQRRCFQNGVRKVLTILAWFIGLSITAFDKDGQVAFKVVDH